MWIERPPWFYRCLFPGVVFRMPVSGKRPGKIYLTFDDGPIPEVTPHVLDILEKAGVKATFFMVGENVNRYPKLLEEVKRRGHKAANHTYNHIRGWQIGRSRYLENVEKTERLIGSGLFRPPHGYLTLRQLSALKSHYKVVMHDLVTRDYDGRLSADDVVKNVKKYTRDGSVIVFHDSLKSWPRLKEALPESLEWLQKMGYEFGVL